MNESVLFDPSPDEIRDETLQYRFRNQVFIGLKCIKRILKQGGDLGVSVSFKQGTLLESVLRHPDEQTMAELMVVMSDLLRPESDIHFETFLNFVRERAPGEATEEVLRTFDDASKRIHQGGMRVSIDGELLCPRDAYIRLLTTVLESDDTLAAEEEQRLSRFPPLRDMLWFSGYSYCADMHRALRWLSDTLLRQRLLPREVPRSEFCIYCTSGRGRFSTREHTLPESLGNSHSILPRGWVCDECQATFAAIEDDVLKMAPFAATKVFAGRYTKEGRFPSAKFAKAHIKKTRPNRLVIEVFGGKKVFTYSDGLDGERRFKLQGLGTKFDHIKVARMLIKATLGAVALERGRPEATAAKYDAARRFALYGQPFAGRLVLPLNAGRPHPNMTITWWDHIPAALFDIQGAKLLVSLAPHDLPDPPEGSENLARVFELGGQS